MPNSDRLPKALQMCPQPILDAVQVPLMAYSYGWIHKPSPKECDNSGCSAGKFHCGRKQKFGLNCQAVCDAQGRILDISILFPGSMSDVLVFEGMSLFHRLEDGILAPGLCLFRDNAYLNTPYLATPYVAVSGGTQDLYNFYHSQV